MNILVVGSGAREHALVWKFRREAGVSEVLCAPGNAGIASDVRCLPVAATDVNGLVELARSEDVALTVVGPEASLERGLADAFASEGLVLFGPSRDAARLETSKAFAKHLMALARVPTARYRVAESPEQAYEAIDELGGQVALKADGLAGGKGVIVAGSREEARSAVGELMLERKVGDAGRTLVVEERLQGPEVSFFAVADGDAAIALMTAQDHKRVDDGDRGPNTGGMGAFSPSRLVDRDLEDRIMRDIVSPVIGAMKDAGTPFRGFLYAGLMLTGEGPKVIEFNVRLGDPEAQVLLPLGEPLLPLLRSAASGALEARHVRLSLDRRVGVVIASAGYPDTFETGHEIEGLAEAAAVPGVRVYHAGTRKQDGPIVNSGGRVLTIVGSGADFSAAIANAYAGVDKIHFTGAFARRDIGRKALLVQS
jgi:phosphoribosylamine---glycine ligase